MINGIGHTFDASLDGSTWYPLNNIESEPTSFSSSLFYANRRVSVIPFAPPGMSLVSVGINWKYVKWLKVIASTAQTADRDIVLIVKERGCSINLEC